MGRGEKGGKKDGKKVEKWEEERKQMGKNEKQQ